MKGLAAAVVAVTILSSAAARAENKAAARAAFAEGTKYYDLNRFEAALKAFERAYWNYEEPAFLFNIAQCYRQLDRKADAVKFYRSYLRKLPTAPNRVEVERIIVALDAALEKERAAAPANPSTSPAEHPTLAAPPPSAASESAATTAPPVQPAEPAERRPVYKRWWLWTTVGIVVAGGVVTAAVLA